MNRVQLDPQICKYIPTWYKPIEEYQQICQTESAQLETLAAAIYAVKENFYFQTMNLDGVEMWESALGIIPNPQTEDLEFRRARVLNRITTKPPFTLGFLHQKLDELIGPGEWTVTVDYPNYTLYIESAAQNQLYATEVAFTINRIKPAHIIYVNKPYIQSGLLLNETITSATRQWNYILGSWLLGAKPFATDLNEEVVKLPTTPSIQSSLLTDTVNFVSGEIASVLVNGSIPITTLSKSVTGSTLTVEYAVNSSQTSEITSVELLDSDGNVLTSSTIYVPVQATTIITHTIPVEEGVVQSGS